MADAVPVGNIIDNLDGSYTQYIKVDTTTREVGINIRGTEIKVDVGPDRIGLLEWLKQNWWIVLLIVIIILLILLWKAR